MNDYQVNYDFFFKQVSNDYSAKRSKWTKKKQTIKRKQTQTEKRCFVLNEDHRI